jgi:nucleotide-binding universal stress UspA family protein
MGTHGRSSLGNVVLGSVASGVLARSRRPVLLIR